MKGCCLLFAKEWSRDRSSHGELNSHWIPPLLEMANVRIDAAWKAEVVFDHQAVVF